MVTNIAANVTELKEFRGCKNRVKISPGRLPKKQDKTADNFATTTKQALHKSRQAKRMPAAQVISAQEKERQRISHELHDGIGQTLSAIKFCVENAIWQMNEHTIEESAQTFRNIIPKIQGAIEEIRRISTGLSPAILDEIGIISTLSWFCGDFQTVYEHIRIELMLDIQEDDVPAALKVVIYRIAQEAMNNCAKHSQADHIHISLVNTGKAIELAVKDNGQGFDCAAECMRNKSICGGMGLVGMRDRTEVSGGMFSLESAKGKGTSIRVVWPRQARGIIL